MKFKLSVAIVMLLSTTVVTELPSQSADTSITVKVKGVGCAADVKMIQASIESLKGITVCDAGRRGPTTSFNIKYNPQLVSMSDIDAAVEGTPGCEDPKDRPYKVKRKRSKRKS